MTGSDDRKIRLWRLNSTSAEGERNRQPVVYGPDDDGDGLRYHEITAHNSAVTAMCLVAEGAVLITGAEVTMPLCVFFSIKRLSFATFISIVSRWIPVPQ